MTNTPFAEHRPKPTMELVLVWFIFLNLITMLITVLFVTPSDSITKRVVDLVLIFGVVNVLVFFTTSIALGVAGSDFESVLRQHLENNIIGYNAVYVLNGKEILQKTAESHHRQAWNDMRPRITIRMGGWHWSFEPKVRVYNGFFFSDSSNMRHIRDWENPYLWVGDSSGAVSLKTEEYLRYISRTRQWSPKAILCSMSVQLDVAENLRTNLVDLQIQVAELENRLADEIKHANALKVEELRLDRERNRCRTTAIRALSIIKHALNRIDSTTRFKTSKESQKLREYMFTHMVSCLVDAPTCINNGQSPDEFDPTPPKRGLHGFA